MFQILHFHLPLLDAVEEGPEDPNSGGDGDAKKHNGKDLLNVEEIPDESKEGKESEGDEYSKESGGDVKTLSFDQVSRSEPYFCCLDFNFKIQSEEEESINQGSEGEEDEEILDDIEHFDSLDEEGEGQEGEKKERPSYSSRRRIKIEETDITADELELEGEGSSTYTKMIETALRALGGRYFFSLMIDF